MAIKIKWIEWKMNNKKKQHKFSKEREREKMVLENVSITVVFRARDGEKKNKHQI